MNEHLAKKLPLLKKYFKSNLLSGGHNYVFRYLLHQNFVRSTRPKPIKKNIITEKHLVSNSTVYVSMRKKLLLKAGYGK